ncbi:histidinol dehydrogenase [Helicobacter saguini]|uniref:Histidinol dehydrogenase n=1 Tax=Helicobacter saguini TaxID=1548018 RepID=A0A347VQ32_9HELI|nr:histidinol dehydrogenase [Helicobacter saguini]MWV61101.1 histidinol dehydrogenase [Helicobacter saguini]MWV68230.1 histidinol dehydrogenase [Helicobacter saguini]MWV70306.1 histidinol dehydrogenase [Helicobacter saguini]MWV72208.1 histidinol dehydrogenase [Helicobacter saguini]TLD95260.1 histidinol dehydrogenase [Helicobacter saguini]
MIKILNTKDSNFENEFNILLNRASEDMDSIIPSVLETLKDIKKRGIDSILELVAKYDSWNPKSLECLKIDFNHAENAYKNLDSKSKDALKIAYDRIYTFHEYTKPRGFIKNDNYANTLGQIVLPVSRAGLYVPGGKAFYPSSLLMNAIPAKVAGVQNIVVTTPTPRNEINELLLAAMYLCDIKEAYKVGGVGAIGLLAYGLGDKKWRTNATQDSKSVRKVDVITGPGNIYVATAKKLVFGEVNIDMIAGPSEIGILADRSAPIDTLAIDMLSQAEHDELASSILITDDALLATQVATKIDKKLATLTRREIAEKSINSRGVIIVVENLKQGAALMNEIAPEHLEIITQNPLDLLPRIKAAGAIFLGRYTPEAIGDYLAGPNHTLPTGGSAKFFSPLSSENFSTRTSLLSFTKDGLESLREACATIADIEGLQAHKLSVLHR